MLLFLAVAISSIAFGAFLGVAKSFNIPTDIACAFAAPVFMAVPWLHRVLLRSRTKPASPGILSLSSYTYPDGVVFVYSFFTILGILALVETINIAREFSLDTDATLFVFLAMSPMLSIGVPLLLLAGKWIGERSSRHGPFVAAAVVIALTIALRAYEAYVVPKSVFTAAYSAPPTIANVLLIMLKNLLVWAVPTAIGFWYGRRSRRMSYAGYLLRQLPAAGRDALIGRMYDDAKSMR